MKRIKKPYVTATMNIKLNNPPADHAGLIAESCEIGTKLGENGSLFELLCGMFLITVEFYAHTMRKTNTEINDEIEKFRKEISGLRYDIVEKKK